MKFPSTAFLALVAIAASRSDALAVPVSKPSSVVARAVESHEHKATSVDPQWVARRYSGPRKLKRSATAAGPSVTHKHHDADDDGPDSHTDNDSDTGSQVMSRGVKYPKHKFHDRRITRKLTKRKSIANKSDLNTSDSEQSNHSDDDDQRGSSVSTESKLQARSILRKSQLEKSAGATRNKTPNKAQLAAENTDSDPNSDINSNSDSDSDLPITINRTVDAVAKSRKTKKLRRRKVVGTDKGKSNSPHESDAAGHTDSEHELNLAEHIL